MSKLFKTLSLIMFCGLMAACTSAPMLPLEKSEEPTVPDISKMVERTLTQMTSATIFQDPENKASIYVNTVTSFADISTINPLVVKHQIEQRINLAPNIVLAAAPDAGANKYELSAEFNLVAKNVSAVYDYRELVFKITLLNLSTMKTAEWTEILRLNRLAGAWE